MLNELNYSQRQRLAYIEFCLEYYGEVSRGDLVQRFQTGLASCSRDLGLYRDLAPSNAVLVHETKKYRRATGFKPLFEHDPETILGNLSKGFSDGFSSVPKLSAVCFDTTKLIYPNPSIIATIIRSMHRGLCISCSYESLSSGTSSRILVPHAIVNNGNRWHIRAFDRKSKGFRDFVCTRFVSVTELQVEVHEYERAVCDLNWNKVIRIIITPHTRLKHTKGIELDYSMLNGELAIEIRVALAGYLLRQWNVDCSQGSVLEGEEYQLRLKNREELEQYSNLVIAPGFNLRKKRAI